MPRKQRMPKARRGSGDALRRELLDLLLDDHPTREAIEALQADGGAYDQWFRFDVSLRAVAALRIQHRDALVAEAQRRGLPLDHLDRVRERCDDVWRLSLPETAGRPQ